MLLRGSVILLGAAFGAACGSFAALVVDRVPQGGSILHPPSTCASCGARIAVYDNIPIISWLVLRGRCRRCATAIPVSLFALEVVGALAGACVATWF